MIMLEPCVAEERDSIEAGVKSSQGQGQGQGQGQDLVEISW